MPYLLGHIVLILTFLQLLRWAQERRVPYLPLVSVNYLVAACCAWLYLWVLGQADALHGVIFSIGSINGVFYVIHLLIMMACIRRCGVGISATVAGMSSVSPVIYQFVCNDALLSIPQLVALSLTPVVLFSCRSVERQAVHWKQGGNVWLLGNFVFASIINILHSVVEQTASSSQSLYTCCLFSAAASASFIVLCSMRGETKQQNSWASMLSMGAVIGMINIAGTICILMALQHLSSVAVFPVAACSIIIGTGLLSFALWSEQLILRQYLGMLGAALVIVLIHW